MNQFEAEQMIFIVTMTVITVNPNPGQTIIMVDNLILFHGESAGPYRDDIDSTIRGYNLESDFDTTDQLTDGPTN